MLYRLMDDAAHLRPGFHVTLHVKLILLMRLRVRCICFINSDHLFRRFFQTLEKPDTYSSNNTITETSGTLVFYSRLHGNTDDVRVHLYPEIRQGKTAAGIDLLHFITRIFHADDAVVRTVGNSFIHGSG